MPAADVTAELPPELLRTIARHWGFSTLRPNQTQAIAAVLANKDSLVVLPTGGGKSLCYQAPAVYRAGRMGITVVVSPLIALMKDQVDALNRIGIPAVRFDSQQTPGERAAAEAAVRTRSAPLVFTSPERLATEGFPRFLTSTNGVRTVAIDEAHCISQWGHDFRPEYRQLGRVRTLFPEATIHAYTATATEQVRADIAYQLQLTDHLELVGDFDRPNLTYRVLPRLDAVKQVKEVIARHPGEAGIVYCLRRKDVESVTSHLCSAGLPAIGYHAGMGHEERRRVQEEFTTAEAPIIVATVAFGMGIDRPDVRFVAHVAMPKSIESYQQEAGRGGRDGLPSECVLFYSGSDRFTLQSIIEKSAAEAGQVEADFVPAALGHLDDMDRYCRGAVCRHKALVSYFGQEFPKPNCGACDLCLGDTTDVPDATVTAQKILSCVARVKESFGVGHVIAVLRGDDTDGVRNRQHQSLSTFGLLKDVRRETLRDWIFQLIGQDVLKQVGDEYPILKLNKSSWAVLRGEQQVRLIQLARKEARGERGTRGTRGQTATPSTAADLSDADAALYAALRQLRTELAMAERIPAYRVFPDSVLKSFATERPKTLEAMRGVTGVGEIKLRAYGERFLAALQSPTHPAPPPPAPKPRATKAAVADRRAAANALFRNRAAPEAVAKALLVSPSTIEGYLVEYITAEKPADISCWVVDEDYQEIVAAAQSVGPEAGLKPIFEALGGQVPYACIRFVLAHRGTLTAGE